MNHELYRKLMDAGEFYAAGLLLSDEDEKSPLWRYSNAVKEFLTHAPLTPYAGGRLYPCGKRLSENADGCRMGMTPEYSYTYRLNRGAVAAKVPEADEPLAREQSKVASLHPIQKHLVGGAGYTHSFINYRRILADGLDGYRERVNALTPADGEQRDFREAMLLLLDGIEAFRGRCVDYLKTTDAPEELIDALQWVPNHTPRNIYEAIAAWNFVYYVDMCDDIGGLDRGLLPYWKGEDVTDLLRELFDTVDCNDAWSCPLGPTYNGLTVQCIRASGWHRRPSLQLLVTKDMPDEVWQAAYESLSTSCGQPAFYNWAAYKREMNARMPQVTDEDLRYIAFGGCTETMIEGLSNVGSDDAGVNTAYIFADYLREHLADHDSFDGFLDGYLTAAEAVVDEVCGTLEVHRKSRAQYRPQPIRTLFIDDCIDRMKDFNAGGARYNWSVINVAGLINVIDSMAVVKKLVYEGGMKAETFIESLEKRDPVFLAMASEVPKHGNDNAEVNEIADRVTKRICGRFEMHTCTPSDGEGRYFAVSNQFNTYADSGSYVKATPDGRGDWEPLCDSCGAVHGRDTEGPTALLNSVAALRGERILGTPITNIRISKQNLPVLLKPLVEAFFKEGGMQLQVTCASKEELLDALEHPEKHQNLVVRIGGFSEYFNRLTPALKQTVIARTEY
ncbi:MAG: hypothetical protein IJF78_00665 [Clostridia bacterium]|nr:hypothetical protein [Clostridia bacterium]